MAHILVIDDDELVRFTLRQILEAEGHEVTEAEDGAAGLRCFRERRPDIVITDIIMPDKDGIETLLQLKQIDPNCRVIAASGGGRVGSTDYLKLASELGADRIIPKPMHKDQIVEAVAAVLSPA